MEISLRLYLKFRAQVLIDYANARNEFLRQKSILNAINQTLIDNGINNFEQFNGDFESWKAKYLEQTQPENRKY